jgi:hypothetical protein
MNVPESVTETTMGETAVTLWSYRTFEATVSGYQTRFIR